jgi:Family of unknown function (DUF6404)
MQHGEKVRVMIAELTKRGFSQYTVAPPVFRLLWAIGYDVPPPMFNSFWRNFGWMSGIFGISFGLIFGGVFILPKWLATPDKFSILEALAFTTLFSGLLFGLSMATYFHAQAKKLKLPSWDEYTGGS